MIGSKHLTGLVVAATTLLTPPGLDKCPPAKTTGSAEGNVVVVAVPAIEGEGTDYVLFVDATEELVPADGRADRVFRLQTKQLPSVPLHRRIDDARVEWTRESVFVRTEADQLRFEVGKTDGEDQGPRYLGYGLSQSTGWNPTLPTEPSTRWYETLEVPDAGESAGCSAGGEGATKCSYSCGGRSSCSVECSADYYACCGCGFLGGASCKCKEVGQN